MCGIVGYIGSRKALPVLLSSLERLEYRGYDSSGIAFLTDAGRPALAVVKEEGKLANLKAKLNGRHQAGRLGIGHTRWATHGEPSSRNAHPHKDCKGKFALVHNGIIENYAEIKKELQAKGHKFHSETDTEVAVHLIEEYFRGDVLEAFRKAVSRLHGFFAFVLTSVYAPDRIFVFKRSNPLVIGVGRGENFIASDAPAILNYTNRMIYLDDDEFAEITAQDTAFYRLKDRKKISKKPLTLQWSAEQAEKGGFPHFMLKEIHEQPEVVRNILKARIKKGDIFFDTIDKKKQAMLKRVERIHLVSCGTAYHAGLVANYMLGKCVCLPVEASVSSEFRYEDPIVGKGDLVVLITQSGETADTLAALREAKQKGAFTLAIVNVVGSTIAREADCVIYTHAGPEIGVASTKAYLAQLTVLVLFSIYYGRLKHRISAKECRQAVRDLLKLPDQIKQTLKQEAAVKKCAKDLRAHENFLYLGRGFNYPTALEGALKLKEITYSHAHGYPAGEMKHGPIALIDSEQPVICLAPESFTYEKMVSNIQEIRARKGIIISVCTQGDRKIADISRYSFLIPKTNEMLSAILTVLPLQLFAYYMAVHKKRDVDQPRNLAKSVTVE